MKFITAIRSFCFCSMLWCAISGCVEKRHLLLDQDDIRYAGFYCDYLLESGVVSASGGQAALSRLDSADLNELLGTHSLTLESLSRKTEVYKRNSELWRAVLEQVRMNILHKTGAVL